MGVKLKAHFHLRGKRPGCDEEGRYPGRHYRLCLHFGELLIRLQRLYHYKARNDCKP